MRIASRLVILFGVCLFLSSLLPPAPNLFFIFLKGAVFLISLLSLLIGFLVTLVIGFVSWRKSSRIWICPALLCIALVFGFILCGRIGAWAAIDAWWFKKDMANYTKIVDVIKSGGIPCNPTITRLQITNLPPQIIGVAAARCQDKSVLVVFIGRGSSFAGHMGYLFKDSETNIYIADYLKQENFHLRQMTDNWYQFSD